MFTDYWKVLLLNFPEMGNTVLFEPGRWWKGNIHGLLKTCSFEIIEDGKYIFLSQKADGEIILVWFFLAFHDISGFGKNGFSCSVALFEWYRN